MKIKACLKCGSTDIHMARLKEGAIFGLTSYDYICEKCNHRGMPIYFDSEQDYKKFLKELRN
jgi:hypothetical protein